MPTTLFSRICLATAILVGVMLLSAGCNRGDQTPAPVPPPGVESREPVAISASRGATLARIRRHQGTGNIDAAERELQAFLVRFPDDPEALVLAAEVAATRGDTIQAVRLLDEAATHSLDDAPQWRTQAALLIARQERWDEAIERLSLVVDEYPDFDQARQHLAEVLNRRGFRFDANEQVRELCRRGGATKELLGGLMVPNRSYTGFLVQVDLDNADQIEQVGPLNVARDLLSKGEVETASRILENSQLVKARNPCALALYGKTLLESQNFVAFEEWIRNAPETCRRYPSYWMAVGGWAMRSRRHEQAVRMFAEAVLREPGDLAANDRMTQALAAAGHADAGERFRERGARIDGLVNLAKTIVAGTDATNQAIDELSKGLNDIGRTLESLAWYQVALERMGAPDEAMQKVKQAKQMLPENSHRSVQQVLLCGLELGDFPLDLSRAQGDSSRDIVPADRRRLPWHHPYYVDIAADVGLAFRYRNAKLPTEREFLMYQQTGGGVGCLDYDLNGRIDLYVAQASGDPPDGMGTQPNLLARNLGDRFTDVTSLADCDDRGFAGGVTAGDWNQDGFPDLVVANIQRNTLFINQGDGTFRVQQGDAVWNEPAFTTSIAMGDVNRDHLPDIVEVNYLDDPRIFDPIEYHPDGTPVALPAPLHFQSALDRVFLSREDGSMSGQFLGDRDVPLRGTGLGVVLTDIDGKPGNEIFIANDHMANHLWEQPENPKSAAFWKNTAPVRGVAYGTNGTPLGCMGIAVADFDENGRIDFHVTNFEEQWSNHYMQSDAGFFEDLVVSFGLETPTYEMVGFGTQAIDFDNNSVIDLLIGNGHVEDMTATGGGFEMPTQLFVLSNSQFQAVMVAGDDGYWKSGHLTRAVAYCDWNRDGRVDLVTTDLKQPLVLLENRTATENHWLQLKLVGTRSERDAIGATIKAFYGSRAVTMVVQSGDGYMCKNESIVHLGLGESGAPLRLEITWPDGERQTLTDVGLDQRWLIVQGEADPFLLDGDK